MSPQAVAHTTAHPFRAPRKDGSGRKSLDTVLRQVRMDRARAEGEAPTMSRAITARAPRKGLALNYVRRLSPEELLKPSSSAKDGRAGYRA